MSAEFDSLFDCKRTPIYGVRLPEITITNELRRKFGAKDDCSNYDFLKQVCRDGFKKLNIPKEDHKKYADRFKYEIETIVDLGFLDYILLVWVVVNYCKENGIATGMGRGSCAGSLMLYLCGVTGVDPLKYDLFFERFISKIRAKKQVVDGITYLDGGLLPDCDLDEDFHRRHEVISYLETLFKGKTSKILTFSSLSGKILMKECGKIVDEKNDSEMTDVTGLIPSLFGKVMDIKEAYETLPAFKDWCDKNPRSYKVALKLRGLIKNKGVHASGFLLSYYPLIESCPIELTGDKELISSYSMEWVSTQNIKLDLLGLKTVSVVDKACELIGIKITDIDYENPEIYQHLQDLKHGHGLFQIEADATLGVCQKVKPKNLSELSAVTSLSRPGAFAFVDKYANYTNNGTYEGVHPFFDSILESTGGVCIYQEQLMRMVNKVGFSLDESELVRRCVGKKKVQEMKEWESKIYSKIEEQKLDPEIGKVLWKIANDSANYQFNKSHACSYSALTAITVYLKFKHPKEFFLSLLMMTRHENPQQPEIAKIQKEMRHFGMKLLPPHILKSNMDFSIEGNDIRYGLGSVKGISDKTISRLANFKSEQSNKFEVFEAAKQAGLGIGILSVLIQSGSLDGFTQTRSRVVLEAQLWNLLTEKEKGLCMTFGAECEYDLLKTIKKLSTELNEKSKPYIKPSRLETIKKKYQPYLEIYNQNKKSEPFANWFYETRALGYSYDSSLKGIFSPKMPNLINLQELSEVPEKSTVYIVGRVDETKEFTARNEKKTKTFKMSLSDEMGSINVLMFNDKIELNRSSNNNRLPEEEDVVIVKGQKMKDCIFAEVIGIQTIKIYTKLSELKDKHAEELEKTIDIPAPEPKIEVQLSI